MPKGDRGDAVKDLQRSINDAGYTPPLAVDGIWGPKTEKGNQWFVDNGGDAAAYSGDLKRYTDGDARFLELGGNPEMWYNSTTDESYIVYPVPNTEPPIPAYWRIDSDDQLQAYFGDAEIVYDRVLSADELESVGGLYQGLNTELRDRDGDPMVAIIERINRDMAVRPYLKDPEVAAIIMAAALEGNTPTEADFQQTPWWRENNDRQRQWLVQTAADPETAHQAIESQRLVVKGLLETAGIFEPSDEIIDYMADQYTHGAWDQSFLTEQINVISDPNYNGVMDSGLESVVEGLDTAIDTNTDETKWVTDKAREWLGPVHGEFSPDQISAIAGRIRNDPNYRDEWLTSLQGSRAALFPEYTDLTASYDEIAQPWRSVHFQILGEQPDETTDLFQSSVQANDLASTRTELRRWGIANDNEKATQDALGSLGESFNFGVRRVV